ncbi:MAG: SusC/RagA family TonB-linked outer membrane protein [Salinivirgaceae bacterium]|nr:SusC/RagA family TonB-linked outer membrane protein [Salinivirgaceae bacterium]
MKRFTMLFVCLAMLGIQLVNAQQKTITGTVTSSEDGMSLPGVSVAVKGTTVGTITNINGQYSLGVSADAQTLVFSFVGMKTQEVAIGAMGVIDVVLEPEVIGVDEVVVTAIGISRSQKTIGYSATNVSNETFEQQSHTEAMYALQGRVAGVTVSSSGGAPGASTKVVIRGYSSLKGNNNPLYVIDGTPIDNSQRVDDYRDGIDFGNRANDINPNDIESMTVLKGAAATALYGPRGANGVIMITTKKGKIKDKIQVEFSSSATVTDVLRLPQMQNTFGQGWSGLWADDENGSWGPKMDGVVRTWGNVVNNSQQTKAFAPVEDNLYEFYDYGTQFNNSLSLSGGNETSSFYLSYGNSTANGILPTEADKNKKNTLNFSGTTKGKKLTANTSINYVNRKGSGIPDGIGGRNSAANLFSELLQIPRDVSIVDMKDYTNNPFNTLDSYFTPYAFNPYYAVNENQTEFDENRIYGNISFDYKFFDWLSAMYRVGVDASSFNRKDWEAIMKFTPGSVQDSKKVTENPGYVKEETRNTTEINQDFLVNFDKDINADFNLNGTLGFSSYQRDYRRLTAEANSLVIPYFYNLGNTDVETTSETYESTKRTYGYFGTVNLGYKDFAFLNLSARQDYSSTLPKGDNSFFYPAANVSFLLNEVIEIPYIDLFKIRGGWGKAGNDADPYLLDAYMEGTSIYLPFSETQFPIGGVGAFEKQDRIGNPELKPEITTETEIGFDIRGFNNRVALDIAYYNRTSDGQILNVTIPPSSGFSTQTINLGEIQNKGIELLATVVPVKTKDFKWDLIVNFTKNKNELLSLQEGVDELILQSAYDVEMVAKVGEPVGILRAPDYARDADGHIIVSASTGIPEGTTEKTDIGDIHADYTLGVSNELTYKNFGLSFSIDYRPGGYFYSGTADLHYFVGNATQTTFNERQPFIVPNSVKPNPYYDESDPSSPEYVENDVAIDMTNLNAYYYHSSNTVANRNRVIPKDYFKLRSLTLSYKLPKEYLQKIMIEEGSIVLTGNNLLLWTPKENNFVDPESTSYGNDLRGEFGEFRTGPTVRSFTASLRLKF